MIRIGTAGWTVPRAVAANFPGDGTHLQRYARVLACAEINSSFYRPHAFKVYAKWAGLAADSFAFSVKLPKTITHEQRLRRAKAPLQEFLAQIAGLGSKLGPILVQLPPSLEFETRVARTFFALLRAQHAGAVVCEPRHPTWFEPAAEALLVAHRVGRVAADPAVVTAAKQPGGWLGQPQDAGGAVAYYRLHGAPKMYWSSYSAEQLTQWGAELENLADAADVWCIFDNTAAGAAIENALQVHNALAAQRRVD